MQKLFTNAPMSLNPQHSLMVFVLACCTLCFISVSVIYQVLFYTTYSVLQKKTSLWPPQVRKVSANLEGSVVTHLVCGAVLVITIVDLRSSVIVKEPLKLIGS